MAFIYKKTTLIPATISHKPLYLHAHRENCIRSKFLFTFTENIGCAAWNCVSTLLVSQDMAIKSPHLLHSARKSSDIYNWRDKCESSGQRHLIQNVRSLHAECCTGISICKCTEKIQCRYCSICSLLIHWAMPCTSGYLITTMWYCKYTSISA